MNKLQAGTVVKLTVLAEENSKWLLTNGEIEIPINMSEIQEEVAIGDQVEVFLFHDRRGELAATTAIPTILEGDYDWARVYKVAKEGAYIDIGTSREVLVPAEDLPALEELWPQAGDHLYVTLRVDKAGHLYGRLATEEKVSERYEGAFEELFNQNIKARPYRLLPVGAFLLGVDVPYRIFVHNSEMKQEPRLGQEVIIRVIDTKDDHSLNGSLLPRKHERIDDDSQQILDYLEQVGGKMPFGDKSSPEEIKDMFKMSKAAFKRALGKLMKAGKIKQSEGWTEKL
ncbi:conserved virulence factor B [Lysinibacillus alkalisoli]|uniref:Conserved virulence factor B n=1 Tax=Lysinibacillus alkalisoli TaxID=1911548 RepID=A0A917G666_9BACI|nr:S1-like domain-containing RNA-binding protein [Lysinibacillus alkalisoli]GGG25104.1 conserved virulence factor B [Lysinibacillus alkalisoli]